MHCQCRLLEHRKIQTRLFSDAGLKKNEARQFPCDIGDWLDYGGLGHQVELEHTKAYVVKPSGVSDKAIVVIQDIYGWQLPHTKYMADMLVAMDTHE